MSQDTLPTACRRAAGWAVDRAYGEISPRAARKLDDHLRACPACAQKAAEASTLAGITGRSLAVNELVSPRVVRAARFVKLRALGQGAVAWAGRVALAFMLALACTQSVRMSSNNAQVTATVSWLVLFSWTVLHAWLLDRLLDRDPSVVLVTGQTPNRLHGRAVAYGLLAAVVLSVVLVGLFLGMDGVHHFTVCKRATGVLPDALSLMSAGALLLVGLAMGAKLGRESSPNMLAVLLLYASIMVPALVRGAPALLPASDAAGLVCLVALWGLSGAYLGSQLSGSARGVQSARAA